MKTVGLSIAILLLSLAVACGDGESTEPADTRQPTEESAATPPRLTPLADAQYADRADKAVAIGETLSLRYFPDNAESFDLDDTEVMHVTLERFELGSPPCGPDDSILSVCDGSVSPLEVILRADNPNDVPAAIPDVSVVSPDGKEFTLYVCPGNQPFNAGSEMLPTTTATVTVCFGSDTTIASLSGWLVKVNTVGLVPEEGGEGYWIHD